MQVMQKLWPHGVDTGLSNTSKHMEHSSCSSDKKLREKGMAVQRESRGEEENGKIRDGNERKMQKLMEMYIFGCMTWVGKYRVTLYNKV